MARPDDGSSALADFFGCPVHFAAGRNALVLDTADLDLPFPGHNPQLLEMLNPALVAALAQATAPASMARQVKSALKRILASGRPDMLDVARELGMSERTSASGISIPLSLAARTRKSATGSPPNWPTPTCCNAINMAGRQRRTTCMTSRPSSIMPAAC